MSIYALKTFIDLVTSIREELGIASNDTTAINRIKRDVNIVYSEVTSRKNWPWLTSSVDLTVPAYVNSGTASVTQNSSTVTLSVAPTSSKSGCKFAIDGYSEIYTIETHAASSTTIKLSNEFTGATNATATYKIWNDRIPLPIDFKETSQVWHDTYRKPVDNVGRQEYRRLTTQQSRNEGPVQFHYSGDYVDPSPTSSITSLPAISTRSSAGVVKTIVFASGLPASVVASVTAGDPVKWDISAAGNATYNGEILISSIGTTSVTNDTITYTGVMELTESATSDATMAITAVNTEKTNQRYRELFIYPYLSSSRQTLHVDYFREVQPLNNDSDEPLIPMQDRIALRYGALHLSWSRLRNPEEAKRNLSLYENKLAKMEGTWQDNLDTPTLVPSRHYLNAKRSQSRSRAIDGNNGPLTMGGSGGPSQATGTANMAATFGSDGVLVASSTVSATELSYVDGATSNIQTQINVKAPIASPTFTGTVTAPTFVGNLTGNVTGTITGSITESQVTNLVSDLALKAPLVSPSFTTPSLGVATATSINGSTIPTSKTIVVTTDKLSVHAATSSSELAGVISDETGTGALVFANGPTLIAPVLGTPASGNAANLTGTATALNIGGNAATATTATTVVTNAPLTGVITSVGNATSIASQTGTGTKFVVDTSPTLVTPNIGVASGKSLDTTANGLFLTSTPTTTTSSGAMSISNAGGTSYIGQEGSVGAGIITGSSAYDLVMAPPVGHNLRIGYNGGAGVAATVDTSGNVTVPGMIVNPIHAGGTGAASTLTLESTSNGSASGDAIIFKTGTQVEAARIDTAGGLRIGRTTTSGAGTESLTILSSQVSGSNAPNGQRTDLVITGDTVNSGAGNALSIGVTRTITTTAPIDTAALGALSINSPALNVPTGVLTNNSSAGYRAIGVNWSGAVTSGSGTISFTQWTGLTFGASTANTGATKTGIKFAAISGATNNAYIADNTFTGSYFISSTAALPSTFGGPLATTAYATSTVTSGTITIATLKPGLIINSAGGTTLTIQLPASPIDGQQCFIGSVGAFTTITWQDAGGTAGNVIGGQAALGGTNRGQTFVYSAALTKWLAVG